MTILEFPWNATACGTVNSTRAFVDIEAKVILNKPDVAFTFNSAFLSVRLSLSFKSTFKSTLKSTVKCTIKFEF